MDEVLFLAAHLNDAEELVSLSKSVWHVDIVLDNKEVCSYLIKKDYHFLLFDFEAGSLYPLDILETIYTTYPKLPIFLLSRQHCHFIEQKVAASTHLAGCFAIPYQFPALCTYIHQRLKVLHNFNTHNEYLHELYSSLQGNSTYIQAVRNFILDVAQEQANVLISGESGTGKEIVASLIHKYSVYKNGAYVPVNSRCINEELAESMLFGACKGSFTGALEHEGIFAQANKGTLFFDEIETLSLNLQAKLLRVIETHEFCKLGGKKTYHSEFRLICATNKDLSTMIEEGSFRSDLFYRINVFHITMPPLRRHKSDIEILAAEYLKKRKKTLSLKALQLLQEHHWPGNIRELFHCLQRALVYAKNSDCIYPEHIDI